jgi:sirohydrochlorin ferrochelatase
VILAAAGTSDPNAQRDLHTMATGLSAITSSRVELAFAATGTPRVDEAVESLRQRGARRVVVASYLLSEGLFQDRLRDSGADVVTEPLGTHPGLVRLIANRFRRARVSAAA